MVKVITRVSAAHFFSEGSICIAEISCQWTGPWERKNPKNMAAQPATMKSV